MLITCWFGLHRWAKADDYGWLRYCVRCEKVEADVEMEGIATFVHAWAYKDERPYIERIDESHRAVLQRYIAEQTLWQKRR